MKPFSYFVSDSIAETLTRLGESGSRAQIIAGGTDLLIGLRRREENGPESIIDISRLSQLRGIRLDGAMMHIGPLATHREIMESDQVRTHVPLLAAAAGSIGSPQVRNRGTIGGNIMNAAACADTVPPLIALGAVVALSSAEGERTCPLSEFFVRPYVTIARPGELLTRISFPVLPAMSHSAFIKLGRRNALAIARLSVAAILTFDRSGVTLDARIVPGAVFPSWKRVKEAEEVLVGKTPAHGLFVEAGRKVSGAMIAVTGRRWSTEYKEPVIAALVQRALARCVAAEPVIASDRFSRETPDRPDCAEPDTSQPAS